MTTNNTSFTDQALADNLGFSAKFSEFSAKVQTKMCTGCSQEFRSHDDYSLCTNCRRHEERRNDAVRRTVQGLPGRHQWASFTAPELPDRVDGDAIKRALDLVDGSERIVIQGKRAGTGKTTLACCLARRLAGKHILRGQVVSARELGPCRVLASEYGRTPRIMREALEAPILVIDDLGEENVAVNSNVIPDVLFKRFESPELVTIVVTTLTGAELLAKYGEGVMRRLTEGAGILRMDAASEPAKVCA